ncbi:sigma-70 family RNA polymerase sigma factor [Neobacillus sp. PS3-34]|uniref:RNA polymerase sigma factor n=1 Tax=Neobacillus sp. PS3-34 TaxID=3070678 RepID=UPI0027DF63DA|nr:sigma-70 family RNA polymerase sigma factor [Neobacillus sp. PS3-34]WML49987.1 sigma-70 family RNA polymerase sigma factor [Neobacillus sp. PS3-34]
MEDKTLEDLFHEYSSLIYRFILLMVSNREEAEDLTQEVFIRVHKALPQFKGESSYKTWLYTIARNLVYDHCRKKRTINLLKELARLERTEPIPEEILELKEQSQSLYQALLALKLSYREIIILRKIKGYQINETAEILGWTESKVKTTLHRALNALRNELIKKGWKNDDQANFI